MKPVQGHFFRSDGCCCAIGAIALADGITRNHGAVTRWVEAKFHPSYCEGFISAFDGDSVSGTTSKQFNAGVADGTAVREAVFGKQGA